MFVVKILHPHRGEQFAVKSHSNGERSYSFDSLHLAHFWQTEKGAERAKTRISEFVDYPLSVVPITHEDIKQEENKWLENKCLEHIKTWRKNAKTEPTIFNIKYLEYVEQIYALKAGDTIQFCENTVDCLPLTLKQVDSVYADKIIVDGIPFSRANGKCQSPGDWSLARIFPTHLCDYFIDLNLIEQKSYAWGNLTESQIHRIANIIRES